MKFIRKLTMVLLMAVLALSVFTACSGGGTMVSNTTDTSVAVKLGASSSIQDNEYLAKLAQLNFHSAELIAEALGGKDVTSADEQCQKDIKSVKAALQSQGIVVDDVICGTGATREEAIADLVANYPNAGKDKKYCGMAEGEISFSILGVGDKSYYVYIVFGTDASGSTSATDVTICLSASPSGCGTVYGSGTYTKGESVTVKATPSKGYSFAGWQKNGSIVSTSASYTFTASKSVTLTAVFEKETTYEIKIDFITDGKVSMAGFNSASSAGTGGGGANLFVAGTQVKVIAELRDGYSFVGWQKNGAIVSTDISWAFTATEDCTLYAVCAKDTDATATVTVQAKASAGGSVSGTGTYTVGERVTVKATPNTGYSFKGWLVNGTTVSTSTSYTFTASEAVTLTAVFEKSTVTVSLSASPSAGGSVSGSGTYTSGTSVTVTASPNSDYCFAGWQVNGSTVSISESYTFTASESCALTAVFGKKTTVTVDCGSYGIMGGHTGIEGRTVTVTAAAAKTFKGWQKDGVIVCTDYSYTFTVTEDCTLHAIYEEKETYNGATAASWGMANYTNNYGLCAEFVWNCLNQGGLSISKQTRVTLLRTALLNTGYFTEYTPTVRSGSACIRLSDNAGKVAVGDVVIYQYVGGSSDGVYQHTALVCKIEGDIVYIVQRNSAQISKYAAGFNSGGTYSWKNGNVKTTILHYTG